MDTTASSMNRSPPPYPTPHRTVDFSPIEFILGLVAVITIPALAYSFIFAIKCPPNFLRLWRQRSTRLSAAGVTMVVGNRTPSSDVAAAVKYNKDEHCKEVGTECPVCLSAFDDGEEIRQLTTCKHSFHVDCIDMWLYSHPNCPVCRAAVPVTVKRPINNHAPRRPAASRSDDFHQGLPDAGYLV
ncbi:RING-H2 finger protein ATL33 [Cucumis melo var. makuwa]|uniref:RING-H2 finger protein ATL33 n=2 Tax=Cucumis melo TaxID=3656 RepID=A0A5D3DN65_CUCMM|nr:RING-H2 finger protein ATL33 [Cucumis melo var. makuwa]TYK25055.1 RING-H2 finger protein ATL33 [Cucumis melo var. makuwa]